MYSSHLCFRFVVGLTSDYTWERCSASTQRTCRIFPARPYSMHWYVLLCMLVHSHPEITHTAYMHASGRQLRGAYTCSYIVRFACTVRRVRVCAQEKYTLHVNVCINTYLPFFCYNLVRLF